MKKGFTLVELLAVIVILAIVLAIAVPKISNLISNATVSAIKSDAKLILKQINLEKLNNNEAIESVSIDNLTNYNISNHNYKIFSVAMINNEANILIVGQNKWLGYIACGTITDIQIYKASDSYACGLLSNYQYTGNYQEFHAPVNGKYLVELWGAAGGDSGGLGGRGAYTKGIIYMVKDSVFYVYVGEYYSSYRNTLSFNGGGSGSVSTSEYSRSANGGGATDIRMVYGDWNAPESLRSRIMVAAGGGGGSIWSNVHRMNGGGGGDLVGISGSYKNSAGNPFTISTGGNQTSGGIGAGPPPGNVNFPNKGQFGIGGYSETYSSSYIYVAGGGGGYYGGGAGGSSSMVVGAAAGGSSFISGHAGCDAIDVSGIHTGQPNHYSGAIFENTQMITGNSVMMSPTGISETGHSGNGFARFTYLGV